MCVCAFTVYLSSRCLDIDFLHGRSAHVLDNLFMKPCENHHKPDDSVILVP